MWESTLTMFDQQNYLISINEPEIWINEFFGVKDFHIFRKKDI